MVLNRRDILVAGTGILLGVALPLTVSYVGKPKYDLNFSVEIYANEDNAKTKLPKDLEYLAHDGSYTTYKRKKFNISDEFNICVDNVRLNQENNKVYSNRFNR